MSTNTPQFATFTIQEKKGAKQDIGSITKQYLFHWPLFVIFLIVFIAITYIYLQRSALLYNVTAEIIIKDDKKQPDDKEKLQEIDLSTTPKLAENEMEVLKSRKIISKIVEALQLWVSYQKRDGLKKEDLYKKSPVTFLLLKPSDTISNETFDIIINDKDSYSLKKSNGEFAKFSFHDKLINDFGEWQLLPNANIGDFIGQKIKIILANPGSTAALYQKAINVDLPNKLAPTIELTIRDVVAQRGKDVLNKLIKTYNETLTQETELQNKQTLDFINKRIAALAQELNSSESAVEKYRRDKGLANIPSQSQIYLENVQTNDSKLKDLNIELYTIATIENNLNSPNQNAQGILASIGDNYPALNNLVEKLSQLQLERDKLSGTTPESSPLFSPIDKQIKNTKAAIKENIQDIKASLEAQRTKLQSINQQDQSLINDIPAQERGLTDVKREQSTKEDLYTYLLQKREEIALNYASVASDARIVDYAYADSSQLPKQVDYAISFIISVIFSIGFIFTRNRINNKITGLQEIKDTVEAPVICELPLEATRSAIIINENNVSTSTEQIRALRAKLHSLRNQNEKGQVTLLVSSVSGEGKSFISSNLAVAFAYSEKKTIIVELDMRKPKINSIFNLPKDHPGISDFLAEKATVAGIIQRSELYPGLDMIGAGSHVKNPSELLEKDQLGKLFSWLKNEYDEIIIDSPPLHLVPDAMSLKNLTDITLYVVRQGYTQKAELHFIEDFYNQGQLPNMHIIFNGIQNARYGYGYIYDKSYYHSRMNGNFLTPIFSNFSGRF